MTDKFSNLRTRLAALNLAGPVSTDAAKWEAATDALDVELQRRIHSRPQAVPMTEAWLDDAMRLADAYADASFDQGLNQRIEDPNPEANREKLAEHLRGITAQAKEGQS